MDQKIISTISLLEGASELNSNTKSASCSPALPSSTLPGGHLNVGVVTHIAQPSDARAAKAASILGSGGRAGSQRANQREGRQTIFCVVGIQKSRRQRDDRRRGLELWMQSAREDLGGRCQLPCLSSVSSVRNRQEAMPEIFAHCRIKRHGEFTQVWKRHEDQAPLSFNSSIFVSGGNKDRSYATCASTRLCRTGSDRREWRGKPLKTSEQSRIVIPSASKSCGVFRKKGMRSSSYFERELSPYWVEKVSRSSFGYNPGLWVESMLSWWEEQGRRGDQNRHLPITRIPTARSQCPTGAAPVCWDLFGSEQEK
ncbi:hypothetical protein C8J57DRAFT_1218522 [Mycena rebaudengoi]|nr:hypothetical protein C8J57DRAFT_1218522 [Mycena rebaudengoi]